MSAENRARKARSLNSSREDLYGSAQNRSTETRFPRPVLKRHSSLADIAREHKQCARYGLEANNVSQFYRSPAEFDYFNETEDEDPVEISQTDLLPSRFPLDDSDNRAVEYMLPESLGIGSAARQVVPENPNFLYRIGSQVFLNAGRDTSISSHGNRLGEGAALNDSHRYVLHLGQSFSFENDSEASATASDDEYEGSSASESKMTKLWEFVIADILGFGVVPESPTAKRALRERKTGTYDPALALGIVAGLT